MTSGLIKTIAAASAVIQQTLSTVKIFRLSRLVISILDIDKKNVKWRACGICCPQKCKKIFCFRKKWRKREKMTKVIDELKGGELSDFPCRNLPEAWQSILFNHIVVQFEMKKSA